MELTPERIDEVGLAGWRINEPRPFTVSMRPSARNCDRASRSNGRLTPNSAAITASLGNCWPTASVPEVILPSTSATSRSTSVRSRLAGRPQTPKRDRLRLIANEMAASASAPP